MSEETIIVNKDRAVEFVTTLINTARMFEGSVVGIGVRYVDGSLYIDSFTRMNTISSSSTDEAIPSYFG